MDREIVMYRPTLFIVTAILALSASSAIAQNPGDQRGGTSTYSPEKSTAQVSDRGRTRATEAKRSYGAAGAAGPKIRGGKARARR